VCMSSMLVRAGMVDLAVGTGSEALGYGETYLGEYSGDDDSD
jgi:hypothetical protein